ncbi:MAG: TauD/TfdA family dioxygenase [Amphritea sp.]
MNISIEKNNNNFSINAHIADQKTPLPALWIRERVQDSSQVDIKTQQRLFNPHLLPTDLQITHASIDNNLLELTFSDNYSAVFQTDQLINEALGFNSGLPEIISWDAADKVELKFDWQEILQSKQYFLEAVSMFLSYGYIIIHNTPTQVDSILNIARKFGYVRDTNFGRYFEVFSKPDANDLAYTPHAIGPHTDNPYRDPVPGIQLLHCLVNETRGGLSTLVDSLSVAQTLKAEDPGGYELLADTAVRFRFYDHDTEHVAFHPIIEKDNLGNMLGIHYSPRLDDLPLLPESTLQHYQAARKRLGELLEDARYERKFKLEAGELMMFDNNRILHGRTGFDPNEGARHLQGCYIDRDGPKSHYRLLSKHVS